MFSSSCGVKCAFLLSNCVHAYLVQAASVSVWDPGGVDPLLEAVEERGVGARG